MKATGKRVGLSKLNVVDVAQRTICEHNLADAVAPVVLMVSGGSDSTALAYIAADLRAQNLLGPLSLLHVNHKLRGADADADALFVKCLGATLGIPTTVVEIDVAAIAEAEHGNVEAIARRERYAAAQDALADACLHAEVPISQGRIFVAHTADDRIENFYMRSIVGTGPGGFRSMRYLNGQVARPLLETSREGLRDYIRNRAETGATVWRGGEGELWREDATNEHTDRFRAFVRHAMVPLAYERNPQLASTLTRTMNLIADEDDMLDDMAASIEHRQVKWLTSASDENGGDTAFDSCLLSPDLSASPLPLRRRVVVRVLGQLLGPDERIDTASVDAVLAGYADQGMNGGYVANIQGNLAVSANKHGVRVEPMAAFRTRRKRI